MELKEYKSIEEKDKIFQDRHLIVNTLSDFQKWYIDIQDRKQDKKMFRGMNEAKYKNYTSAQRIYITHDLKCSGVSLIQLVQMQLDKLAGQGPRYKYGVHKSLLRRYFESLNVIPNDLLFLSFAQHYGGISPLLDFSRKLDIALYFMVAGTKFSSSDGKGVDNYASIYYLPVQEYKQEIHEKIDKDGLVDQLSLETMIGQSPFVITDKKLTIKEQHDSPKKSIFSFSNFNIIAQEGGFVFFLDKDETKQLQPLEDELYCVDIHKSIAPYIEELLQEKKFTESYVFPQEENLVKLSMKKVLSDI